MEYRGLTEIKKEISTKGKCTKIALQAITDFQNKNIKTAKLEITYIDEQELKTLYNALKSLIRRRKTQGQRCKKTKRQTDMKST